MEELYGQTVEAEVNGSYSWFSNSQVRRQGRKLEVGLKDPRTVSGGMSHGQHSGIIHELYRLPIKWLLGSI